MWCFSPAFCYFPSWWLIWLSYTQPWHCLPFQDCCLDGSSLQSWLNRSWERCYIMFRCCWSAWVECVSPVVWVGIGNCLTDCVLLAVLGLASGQDYRGDHHLAVEPPVYTPSHAAVCLFSSSMSSSSVLCNFTLKWWLPCSHHKYGKLDKHTKRPHHHPKGGGMWETNIINWHLSLMTNLGVLALGKSQKQF